MPPAKRIPIPGSEVFQLAGAKPVGQPDPDQRLEVSVLVRLPPGRDLPSHHELADVVRDRGIVSHDEYEARFGATDEDCATVVAYARDHQLTVIESLPGARTIRLEGTVRTLESVFEVDLQLFDFEGSQFIGHLGKVHVHEALEGVVVGVFGLDQRPIASRQLATSRQDLGPSFTVPELAALYDFPPGLDGSGHTVALIQLGGGYTQEDLDTYFQALGLPTPRVSAVGPDREGGRADREVTLDLQVVGAIVPGAHLVTYFARDRTKAGFVDVINQAVHDREHDPGFISISWGGKEVNWSQDAITEMSRAFIAAAMLGKTVCVASGDSGASGGLTDGELTVYFPASEPTALACGGTSVTAEGGAITSEVVWDGLSADGGGGGSGGGVSAFFPLPPYQLLSGVPPVPNNGGKPGFPGRGVPDVAGNADPDRGYQAYCDGSWRVAGGTSAVAPLWAGLLVRISQALGVRLGFVNPLLYPLDRTPAFRDVVEGDNGFYQAGPGWDACTGLGSPVGRVLLERLRDALRC